MLEACCF